MTKAPPIRGPVQGLRGVPQPVHPPAPPAVLPGSAKSPVPALKLPGSTTPKVGGLPVGTINVNALQQFLRSKGYDIQVDGKLGPQTRAAIGNFGVGKLPPKYGAPAALTAALKGMTNAPTGLTATEWNQHYGTGKTKSVVTSPVDSTLTPQGNMVPGVGANGTVDLRGLGAIAAQQGQIIPQALADQLANNAAGAQFDPQIHDAQVQLTQAPVQAAQNQHDIGAWYGQVQGAQKTATARDHAISGAGVDSQRAALAAIISSLGGSANEGSASVGAAGENSIGTLQALGNVQDQYNSDLSPLLKLAQSGAATGQAAKDQNALTALHQSLANLQGQRGQVQASTKADTLMKIIQANNATNQQGFQNRMNVQAAGEAAQLNGYKALYYGSRANQPGKGDFAGATPSQIQAVQNAVLKHVLDGNGNPLPGMTSAKAAAIAKTVGSTFFPSTGVSSGWATSVVSPFFPNG